MSIKRFPSALLLLSLALVILQGSRPVAASGHYGGGGGGGGAVEPKCLRWAKIPTEAVADLGSADGGDGGDGGVAVDMADAGATVDHTGEVCVERAKLFSCAVAGPGRGPAGNAGYGALAGLLILAAARRRAGSYNG